LPTGKGGLARARARLDRLGFENCGDLASLSSNGKISIHGTFCRLLLLVVKSNQIAICAAVMVPSASIYRTALLDTVSAMRQSNM
jgi:hypothetical protein